MILNDSKYNRDWEKEKLSTLGDFSRGVSKHRPRNDDDLFRNGKYPFLQTGEIKEAKLYVNDYSLKYNDFGLKQSKLWPKGTLCITIAANIAETAILGREMCFPDSIVGFIPNKNKTSSEYMYYIFEYIKKQIQNRTSGSIQDNINIDYLKGLEFRISPEQDKITQFLSGIDKKIIVNTNIIHTLESMAKTLYDYWFVQFDFHDANGRPYKTSGGKMVWNEELGREIPEGWECYYLKDIAKITTSSSNPRPEVDYLHYSIPAFDDGMIAKKEKGVEINSNKYIVPPNSILVSKLNPQFKRVWFISETGDNSICSTEFIPFTPINGKLGFIYAILSSSMFQQFMIQCSSSSTGSRKRMDPSMCLDYKFAYPNNDDLINTLDSIVQSAKYKTFKLLEENQQLITLRDFLLPMLMNGQVTFK